MALSSMSPAADSVWSSLLSRQLLKYAGDAPGPIGGRRGRQTPPPSVMTRPVEELSMAERAITFMPICVDIAVEWPPVVVCDRAEKLPLK